MNKLACTLLVAMASMGIGVAQYKVAVVNSQKAILETAEIKKAQVDLEAKFKPRQDQMARLTKELQDIQTQLQSGKLNQNGEQELTAQGQRKQRDLQRLQDNLQAKADLHRNAFHRASAPHMREIGKKRASERGLAVAIVTRKIIFCRA